MYITLKPLINARKVLNPLTLNTPLNDSINPAPDDKYKKNIYEIKNIT